jgi:hypothetical protein
MRKLLLALALGAAFIVPTMAQNQQQPPEKWSDRWFKELTDPNTQTETAKDFVEGIRGMYLRIMARA